MIHSNIYSMHRRQYRRLEARDRDSVSLGNQPQTASNPWHSRPALLLARLSDRRWHAADPGFLQSAGDISEQVTGKRGRDDVADNGDSPLAKSPRTDEVKPKAEVVQVP